jgi:hypothetical protein
MSNDILKNDFFELNPSPGEVLEIITQLKRLIISLKTNLGSASPIKAEKAKELLTLFRVAGCFAETIYPGFECKIHDVFKNCAILIISSDKQLLEKLYIPTEEDSDLNVEEIQIVKNTFLQFRNLKNSKSTTNEDASYLVAESATSILEQNITELVPVAREVLHNIVTPSGTVGYSLTLIRIVIQECDVGKKQFLGAAITHQFFSFFKEFKDWFEETFNCMKKNNDLKADSFGSANFVSIMGHWGTFSPNFSNKKNSTLTLHIKSKQDTHKNFYDTNEIDALKTCEFLFDDEEKASACEHLTI